MAQTVKNLPAKQEITVQSLNREDALEKGVATHSRTLAWKILWTEEPGGLQSVGLQRVGHNGVTECACMRVCACAHTHIHIQYYWGKKTFYSLTRGTHVMISILTA